MKTIIRESFAMIISICAILLILVTVFFDYIKNNSIEITGATYQLSQEEQEILNEKQSYLENQNKIVLSSGYSITEEDLKSYKASGELKSGQSNPFEETLSTEAVHDADGSIHYKSTNSTTKNSTSSKTNTTNKTKNTNNTNNVKNESNYFENDISAPSVGSGSIIPQKSGKN